MKQRKTVEKENSDGTSGQEMESCADTADARVID
jgi:hypothetical protein